MRFCRVTETLKRFSIAYFEHLFIIASILSS